MGRTLISVICTTEALKLRLHPLTLVCLILAFASPCESVDNDIDPDDKASLLFFRSWMQDPNQRLSNWVGSNCTTWTGITCDTRTSRVVSINLSSMNLSRKFTQVSAVFHLLKPWFYPTITLHVPSLFSLEACLISELLISVTINFTLEYQSL